jgi:CheY-like chemotaxis protein
MTVRVLMVDDDQTLLSLLGQFLRDQDFNVYEALSGGSALRLAYEMHPDIVLLDVMLPGMDGWEICARLREMSHVPIIMLTAKATEADKLRGFRLGVDDYVTKPFCGVGGPHPGCVGTRLRWRAPGRRAYDLWRYHARPGTIPGNDQWPCSRSDPY